MQPRSHSDFDYNGKSYSLKKHLWFICFYTQPIFIFNVWWHISERKSIIRYSPITVPVYLHYTRSSFHRRWWIEVWSHPPTRSLSAMTTPSPHFHVTLVGLHPSHSSHHIPPHTSHKEIPAALDTYFLDSEKRKRNENIRSSAPFWMSDNECRK